MMGSEGKQSKKSESAQLASEVHHATRSVLWAQLASQAVSFLALGFLYRWVEPEEFGLLGMIMPVVLLLRSIGTLGLNVAAVQKQQLTDSQASTLYWLQVLFGLLFTLILAGISPLLASVYSSPELLTVGIALSATALLSNSLTQQQAMLERKLQLAALVKLRLVSQLCAAVIAIALAYQGFGIWALVTQQYVELVILNLGLWIIEPWKPSWPKYDPSTKQLLKFGGYYTLSGLLFALAQNLDKILLSYWIGGSVVGQQFIGYYTQAFSQMMKPVYLMTAPITGAMLPALSKAHAAKKHFVDIALDFYRIICISLAPCMIGLFLVANDLMLLLGGTKWEFGGKLLTIFALTILSQGLINICGSLLASIGRTGMLAAGAFFFLLVMSQSYIGAYWLSSDMQPREESIALGIAWAFTLSTLIISVPYLIYCFTLANMPKLRLLGLLRSSLFYAIAMGASVFAVSLLLGMVSTLPTIAVLLIKVGTGVSAYLFLARSEVRWLWGRLKNYSSD